MSSRNTDFRNYSTREDKRELWVQPPGLQEKSIQVSDSPPSQFTVSREGWERKDGRQEAYLSMMRSLNNMIDSDGLRAGKSAWRVTDVVTWLPRLRDSKPSLRGSQFAPQRNVRFATLRLIRVRSPFYGKGWTKNFWWLTASVSCKFCFGFFSGFPGFPVLETLKLGTVKLA